MKEKSVWGLLTVAAILNTLSATIIKVRLETIGDRDLSSMQGVMAYTWVFLQSPVAILALVLFNVSPLLSFIALNRVQLSLAYPVLVALQFIFIGLFSNVMLGESFSAQKTAAMFCVLLSLLFFYRAEKEESRSYLSSNR